MLKPYLLFSATCLFAFAAGSTINSGVLQAHAQASANKMSHPSAEVQAKAKRIYKMDCALCHGNDGSGKTDIGKSMNLNSDWTFINTLSGKTDEELFDTIRKGKGSMPAETTGRADDSTVKGLIYYIRNMSKADKGTEAAPVAPTTPAPAAESSK